MLPVLIVLTTFGAPSPTTVAVYRLDTPDLAPAEKRVLKAALTEQLQKLQGVGVVIATDPAPPTGDESCGERPAPCLVALALAVGADEVVTGRTSQLGEAYVFSLKRLRIRNAEVVGAVTRQWQGGDGASFLLGLPEMVAQLYPDHPLRAGTTAPIDDAIAERWDPDPIRPWGFWSALGGTAAVGAVALTFGLLTQSSQRHYDDTVAAGRTQVIDGRRLAAIEDQLQARAAATNWSLLGAALSATATVVIGLLTDWGDDAAIDAILAGQEPPAAR